MSSKSAVQLLDEIIAELENVVSNVPACNKDTATKSIHKQNKTEKKLDVTVNEDKKEQLSIDAIDLRVGIIRKVAKHETAEKLYCEEIDVGEEHPRMIASGLVPYYSLDDMQDRKLIVVCNLKPRNLVGFKSHGMVLCASTTLEDGSSAVEFVDPPADSKPGDRIIGEGLLGEPYSSSKCDKSKAFDLIAPDLKVDESGIAYWQNYRLVCGGISCTAPTLRNAAIR